MNGKAKGLDYWRRELVAVRMPVLSTAQALETLLDPGIGMDTLRTMLHGDIPLALEVILLAAREPRIDGEVQGLQHALNMLGVDKVQALARRCADQGLDASAAARHEAVRAMATSQFGRVLQADWAHHHGGEHAEYLEWLTLLLGVARWKLPLAAPELHQEIEARAAAGERRARVEEALLGCSPVELNAAHLQDLGLPASPALTTIMDRAGTMLAHAGRYAWQGGMAPELPIALARYLHQRGADAVLAHLIAWATHDNWYGGHTTTLLHAASAMTNLPLDEIVASTRRVAVRISHAAAFIDHRPVACERFFWPPPPPRSPGAQMPASRAAARPADSDAHTDGWHARSQHAGDDRTRLVTTRLEGETQADEPSSAAPKATQPKAHGGIGGEPVTEIIEAFMQNCQHGRYRDLRAFFADTAHTLEQGLGLARCLLFLKASAADRLSCYFAYGFAPEDNAKALWVPAGDDNLLARLFRHAVGSTCIDRTRLAAGRRQLPEVLRAHVRPAGFLLGAIHLGDRPVGVIWADGGDADPVLDANRHAEFKHMIRHFGAEFTRLTQALRR